MPNVIEAEEVRKEALPPQSGGVSDDTLNQYITESEGEVHRSIGSLPLQDVSVRGFVRDLAASRALLTLAKTREQYDDARALAKYARDALASYVRSGGPDSPDGQTAEGVNAGAVANVDSEPMWSEHDFDITRRIRAVDGGDTLEGWPW